MAASATLVKDFVNTVDFEDGREELATPADLARWLSRRKLLARAERGDESHLRRALELREALRILLLANNGVRVDVDDARATLDRFACRTKLGVGFAPALELRPAASGVDGALGRVLAAAAETMAAGEWVRLKACRSESCRWAFYDEARNRSRAWCSMAVCGNRAKARTYRQRHAAAG
jgi:predicted RNA-binding Zn ribbon-like protein